MAYNLVISENADRDVDGIIDYIAVELSNPPAAASFADRLSACYDRLEENPLLYALTPHPFSTPWASAKRPLAVTAYSFA